jgi:hypothetical protein
MKNYTNAELLAKLESSFKSIIDVNALGDSVLQPAKFAQFVRSMQYRTVILDEARFIEMDSDVVDIDRVGFVGRIMHSGTSYDAGTGAWAHRELSSDEYSSPTFATNKLTAKELQAVASLRDKSLRRNIERGNFEATLIDLFGEAAGRDMEEFALLADTSISYSDDDVLSLTDGWIKLAGQKVYGTGSGKDFDPSTDDWPENMFDAMLSALPKQFLQNESEFRFYVDWDTRDDYIDLLRAKGTDLGDRAQVQSGALTPPYKGVPVKYVPILGRSNDVADGGAGRVALFSHPNNMAWGIFHEVTIEPDRVAKDRRTDFVMTVEADSGYEDENGAVAAFIEQPEPSS